MSCSACFCCVNAAMIQPTRNTKVDSVFAKYRTVARPNEILCPAKSVTFSPIAFFPRVAWKPEDSKAAKYIHAAINRNTSLAAWFVLNSPKNASKTMPTN